MGNVSTQVQDVKEILSDWLLFQTQVGDRLTHRIMRLKHSDDPRLNLGGSNLDGNASRRLGEILSQNESLKALT